MKSNIKVILAVAVMTLAVLACQGVSVPGGGGSDTSSTPSAPDAPVEQPAKTDNVILRDDFSSEQWGTGTDADSAVEYLNDALNFFVIKDFYYVWSTPNTETYENVHIEVTAKNDSTDSLGTFGIICDLQVTNSSYYFSINSSSAYAISKSVVAGDDVVLTNNGEWTKSDLIPEGAPSYHIGVDCGNGTLTLYVNGKMVDSVSDATYASGKVGLFAWSDEKMSGTNVSFDDFLMTKLP